ncbi:DNA polymerase III epsilon subunit [Bacillus phage Andromeda]|uniref:DNA polymerase III epsilon subunit n=2 Tax=Andromedavirus andromeda TaxID=1273739 RepID=M1I9N3_9CAUD|nr:DNA polymerase III epsilon subunit [Bacillus phage Andromeda]AGE60911.1 DNA polymerase III epsilon subunit [Bacillus phage Gemini]AGE61142.1 DNA polymerase III epsilon subunit [Bacillus phage Andromeda]
MYTIIDFETTGLDHTENQVIEIGAMKIDSTGYIMDTYHKYVRLNKGRQLDPKIVELTGITEGKLFIFGVNETTAMQGLEEFIGDDIIVAHFASFDLAFANNYGIGATPFLCTRSMFQMLHPQEKASLKNCMEFYGFEYVDAHRALNDVVMTLDLLNMLIGEANERGELVSHFLNVMTEKEDRPLKFVPRGAKVIRL